jgi:hypothetical protein
MLVGNERTQKGVRRADSQRDKQPPNNWAKPRYGGDCDEHQHSGANCATHSDVHMVRIDAKPAAGASTYPAPSESSH